MLKASLYNQAILFMETVSKIKNFNNYAIEHLKPNYQKVIL